jgi:hypothetical protein
MTTLEQTASVPPTGRQPAKRPSAWRKFGAFYLDALFATFIGWMLADAFAVRDSWSTITLGLYVLQNFICRGTLKPTVGDFFMGIRYLSSSSNQVVADIRIINPKLKLSGFLLFAGAVETTWAVLSFSLWTFLDKAVFLGHVLENPNSFLFYTIFGFLMFFCATLLLSTSRKAQWTVPIIHGCLLLELIQSATHWLTLIPSVEITLPWAEKAARINGDVTAAFVLAFGFWTLVIMAGVYFSRKNLTI